MGFKCIHIADIHFRGLSRHDEYRESFTRFFEQARALNPDVIYVGGDIVHSKTQGISPELIDILSWWFTGLASIAPTHIILGNHDGLILNKHRQDAISPIINALDNPNLHLYKDSGTYPTGVPGYNWCVFSCFDEERWKNVQPTPGDINIALFHGGVYGSVTDINWDIEGEVETSFFKDYDFTFLGDIHKCQYLDEERRIAYPGSTIQQNYGEDPGKGFLFWDISDRNSFISTFHEVPHSQPFVTIPWLEDVVTTVENAKHHPDGARFRVKSEDQISQVEIRQLCNTLKDRKSASEIVFKYDHQPDNTIITTDDDSFFKEDLRDPKTHMLLMRKFYRDKDISETEWEKLDEMINRYIARIPRIDSARNVKWSIKKLKFANLFAYGKDNIIDFEKLGGITGIFGKNRTGKSSIPGAIMYGLYNTTDRGPIKNLHIINTRKGHCETSVDINVNSTLYRIDRQSVKHQTKRGALHASTQLNLFKYDSSINDFIDMTGEQRRETEKSLRKLIGNAEDFLMTSLASQGQMNSFIREGATQRKTILARFLELNIFDEILFQAKEDSAEVKILLKKAPDIEWGILIDQKSTTLSSRLEQRENVDDKLIKLRSRLNELRISLATRKDKDMVTQADIESQKKKINQARSSVNEHGSRIKNTHEEVAEARIKLLKIEQVKDQFPIEELKANLESQFDLERSLVDLEYEHEKEGTLLKGQEKSIKLLSEVPCGDKFPTCKFIKNSHNNKKLFPDQQQKIKNILEKIKVVKISLRAVFKENLEKKIEKYEDILSQESEIKVQISDMSVKLHENEVNLSKVADMLENLNNQLKDMSIRVVNDEDGGAVSRLKNEITDIEIEVSGLAAKRSLTSESVGLLTNEIKKLRSDEKEYKELITQWRMYELFMNAVSKRGIPLQIMFSQLPVINSEISKILQDVTGFSVELETAADSNVMDIYINYGDSRRIIECASGMEKMMASLAIRVALINVSSLPKTDLLIIDEGFGALDDTNVEACNRLLESLKRWFRNIIVISHVDAIKDAVDNVLDITKEGKDARIQHH